MAGPRLRRGRAQRTLGAARTAPAPVRSGLSWSRWPGTVIAQSAGMVEGEGSAAHRAVASVAAEEWRRGGRRARARAVERALKAGSRRTRLRMTASRSFMASARRRCARMRLARFAAVWWLAPHTTPFERTPSASRAQNLWRGRRLCTHTPAPIFSGGRGGGGGGGGGGGRGGGEEVAQEMEFEIDASEEVIDKGRANKVFSNPGLPIKDEVGQHITMHPPHRAWCCCRLWLRETASQCFWKQATHSSTEKCAGMSTRAALTGSPSGMARLWAC